MLIFFFFRGFGEREMRLNKIDFSLIVVGAELWSSPLFGLLCWGCSLTVAKYPAPFSNVEE